MENIKPIFLTLFFVGLVGVFAFRIQQVKKAGNIPFFAEQPSFISQPPSDAIIGKLLSVEGRVEKEARGKDELEEIDEESDMLQGERLITKEKSKAEVEFPDFAKIDIGSDTEMSFINLLPSSFLVEQKTGEVDYKLLQDENPVSARCLHALLSFYSGEIEVGIEDGEITIWVLEGKAKLAMVDLENNTHVWQFEKDQKVLIDDATRTTEIKRLQSTLSAK